MSVLKGHTERVSKVVFAGDWSGSGSGDVGEAVSCGFDSTVRKWDIESGVCTTIIVSVSIFLSINLFKLMYLWCRRHRKNRSSTSRSPLLRLT